MAVRPNDRCPCGSGKKHKKCCGRVLTARDRTGTADVPLSDDECREVANALLTQITESIPHLIDKKEIKDAVRKFRGIGVTEEAFLNGQEMAEYAFPDFLVHDWRPARRGTILKRFQDFYGQMLSPAERTQVERWLTERRRGWFEVEGVIGPGSTQLRDCMTGETHLIYDHAMARQMRKGHLILAAIFPCGGRWEMEGCAVNVARSIRRPFKAWLEAAFDAWRRERPAGATWARFFSEQAPEIEREMTRLSKTPPLMVTTTGELLAFETRVFSFESRETVFQRLRTFSALRFRGWIKGNRVDGDAFDWCHDRSSGALPFGRSISEVEAAGKNLIIFNAVTTDPGRSPLDLAESGEDVLASLIIDSSRLEIQAYSTERLEYVSEALLPSLSGLVTECEGSTIDPDSIDQILEQRMNGKLDVPKPKKPDLSPEAAVDAERILGEFKKKHWEAWPDVPLAGLGGKTPREASRDPIARIELEALLRDIEVSGGDDQPDPHLLNVRKELGMD